jgi:ABC-2 type transport system permease protein
MKIYRAHILAVIVPLLRTPVYWIPVVLFPVLLYSFFGVPASQRDIGTSNLLLASWSAFAVIGVGFFQFGVSTALSRESKWEDYARTLPVGGAPKMMAQIAAAAFFISIALMLLWSVSASLTVSALSTKQYIYLFFALMGGVIPFVLMGIALGYFVSPRGAVPIANLIYLPLSYLGGLWTPPKALPKAVADLSMYTPTRHLGELAWSIVQGRDLPVNSMLALTACGAISGALALTMWRRDEAHRAR